MKGENTSLKSPSSQLTDQQLALTHIHISLKFKSKNIFAASNNGVTD